MDETILMGFPAEDAPSPLKPCTRNHLGSIRMGGSSGDFMKRSFSLLGSERMKNEKGENQPPQEETATTTTTSTTTVGRKSKGSTKPAPQSKSRWKRFRNSVRKAATGQRSKVAGSRVRSETIAKAIESNQNSNNLAVPPPKPSTAPVAPARSPSTPVKFHQHNPPRPLSVSPKKRAQPYAKSPVKRLTSRVSSSEMIKTSPSKHHHHRSHHHRKAPMKPSRSPTPSARIRAKRDAPTILVKSPRARGAGGGTAAAAAAAAAKKPAVNMKVEVPKIAKLLLDRAIDRTSIVATKVVGSGQFGKVYLAKQKMSNGKWVPRAVKVVVGDANPENDAMFVRETATLAPLDHPNINKLVGVCFSERPWLAVLELAEYGDLRKCLQNFRKKRFQLHPMEQLHLCKQIASGLHYLHSQRMVHRDIALRNILLGTNSQAKIADFGHARKYDEGKDSFLMLGTERVSVKWAPIEIFTSGDKHFNQSTDVWSFGITMWEVLSYSKNPYESLQPNKVPRAVKDGYRLPNPGCPSHIHKFMLKCWEEDPAQRLRFSQIEGFITNRMAAIQANDPEVQIRDIMAEYCKKHTNITKTLTGTTENETPTTPYAERAVPATPAAATPAAPGRMAALDAPPAATAAAVAAPSGLRLGESASDTAARHGNRADDPTNCNECTSTLIAGNWYRHNDVGFGVCRKCYYTAFSAEQAQINFTWVDVTQATNAAALASSSKGAVAASSSAPAPALGGKKGGGGAIDLRRAAMTRGAAAKDSRLTALAQAMDGISPRTRGTLRSQAEALSLGSPQAPPWTPPPSMSMYADAVDSPLVGSTPSVSVDSPALFFAQPPAPPPTPPAPPPTMNLHVDL